MNLSQFVISSRIKHAPKELAHNLKLLENRIERHDGEIKAIFGAIRQLMAPPISKKGKIGFRREPDK